LSTRYSRLRSRLEHFEHLASQVDDLSLLLDMAAEETGETIPQELADEIEPLSADVGRTLEALEEQRLFTGEFDRGDAIVSIHPGAGGTESQDWAEMLLRLYLRWAEKRGFSVELNEASEGDVTLEIDDKDLRVETYRSSGAGGQHVNKTDSAVRITHVPTKTVVQCQNERSQIQNRETAMRMLRGKLLLLEHEKRDQEMAKEKGEQREIAWGSQIRSYVLAPYTLVKDHRTNFEKGNVEAVLGGAIDEFIRAYVWQRSTGKLGGR
jgi:peptide chain release factor 2